MKILRIVLLLAGFALVLWGITDYVNNTDITSDQALPKIFLGFIAALASLLAKNRR
ncbi:MAG: hypothetical protein AAF466_09230 [Bacteroidota bacterium]